MSGSGPHLFLHRSLLGQKLQRPAARLIEDDAIFEDDCAVDDRRHDAGAECHSLKRRPAALILERLRRNIVRPAQIDDHQIGIVTLAQEPPVHDAKEARGIMRDFGDDLLQREYAAVVLLQKHL